MPGRLNPVFAHLAINRAWAEVFARLDRGEAGVSDFDSGGMTALHWAAARGADDAVDELVRRGATVSSLAYDGWTPLHSAAYYNMIGDATVAAERLLHHGADLNAKCKNGDTPVDVAQRYGNPQLEACLKKARAHRLWAEARAFGRAGTGALACVSFWHAYVDERHCAPGGKWAERDSAAFEEESE